MTNRERPVPVSVLRAVLLVMSTLVAASCTFRFLADYDEIVVAKTVELQEQAESLFVALTWAAETPDDTADGAYAAHADTYKQIFALLQVMEVRASLLDKNEITIEQLQLLRDSMASLQQAHQRKSAAGQELSADTIRVLRIPFTQQIVSILKLQQALRRGT